MHHADLDKFKANLKCCFCRNPLANMEMVQRPYKGDFVAVYCEQCASLDKKWGPKFLICCCSKEPQELSIEMAEGEIKQQELSMPTIEVDSSIDYAFKDSSTGPKAKKKVPKL